MGVKLPRTTIFCSEGLGVSDLLGFLTQFIGHGHATFGCGSSNPMLNSSS